MLIDVVLAEDMLEKADYFQNGKVDKNALVSFIRDIKKNTKLSDKDAAVIAASKVTKTSFIQVINIFCSRNLT